MLSLDMKGFKTRHFFNILYLIILHVLLLLLSQFYDNNV